MGTYSQNPVWSTWKIMPNSADGSPMTSYGEPVHKKGCLHYISSTLDCLKEDTQACPRHGNATECLVPFSGNRDTCNPETFPFEGNRHCIRFWRCGNIIPNMPCWPMPAPKLWKSTSTILSGKAQKNLMRLNPELDISVSTQLGCILWHHSLAP